MKIPLPNKLTQQVEQTNWILLANVLAEFLLPAIETIHNLPVADPLSFAFRAGPVVPPAGSISSHDWQYERCFLLLTASGAGKPGEVSVQFCVVDASGAFAYNPVLLEQVSLASPAGPEQHPVVEADRDGVAFLQLGQCVDVCCGAGAQHQHAVWGAAVGYVPYLWVEAPGEPSGL